MGNLIQLQKGSKSYGLKSLFSDSSFSINDGEHVGVIGPNGAGKSTLFKILSNHEDLDSGKIIKSNQLRLGYLSQEDDWSIGQGLGSYLENCTLPIWDLKNLGRGLGLGEEYFSRPIESFSGGFRMRSQLLHVIGCQPNLMLLDEPTNYLDLESLIVLEDFLIHYKGAFLLISHDREFLRRVTRQTLEVENSDITKFPGDIDDYFEQKEMIREQVHRENISLEAKRKKIMDFVSRFGAKNTKATQAQSKLKQLKKLKKIEIKPLPVSARINIPNPIQTGKQIFQMSGVDLGYGDLKVLKDVHIQLFRGDHLGVVGVNGAGKSTLLKALAGELKPILGGISWGAKVEVAYFAQHVTEKLDPGDSIYESLAAAAHPDVLPQDLLDMAGSLLFAKEDTEKKIKVLSGGEKTRLALGKILLKKAPFLVLDEPTNHLDFSTVEALTQALQKYIGTLIVVSHDRTFISRVATKILEIKGGGVNLYPGNYTEYVWSLKKGILSLGESLLDHSTPSELSMNHKKPQKNKKFKKEIRVKVLSLDRKIKAIEKQMELDQKRLLEVSEELVHRSSSELKNLLIESDLLSKSVAQSEKEWIDLSSQREELMNQI